MKRFWFSTAGVLAVLAAVIGINVFADARLAHVQLDVTAQHLYTLDNGTRQVLAGLKEPVTLRLFYSRKLGSAIPVYGAYADRVREMLAEYAAAADGRIRLEFLDPEPFSETEDRALAYGLQGVPIDQAGEQVYFGLVGTNLVDDERTIPFFQPDRERFLEYDLTRLVHDLSSPKRPVVGLMTALPLNGDPQLMMMAPGRGLGGPWVSRTQLGQFFNVKDVALDAQVIPPDVEVLAVVHPQNLPDSALYAIDQFVMRGGRLMVLVDPHSEAQASRPGPGGQPPRDTASNLAKLFDAWGIAYDPNQVVGDLVGAARVRSTAPNDRGQAVDYVAWFNIRNGIARNDPATGELQQVSVASAGQIARKDGASIEFTPILTSSDRAAMLPAEKVRTDPDPAAILAGFKPDGERHIVGARVRGVLKSAFTEAPPPPEGAERPADFPAHLAESKGPANLVVIADSDILADRFWVRLQDFFGQQVATPFADNGALLVNLVDTLAGGDNLIALRSRGDSLRPFETVENIRRNAELAYRQTEAGLQQKLEAAEKKLRELRQGQRGPAARTAAVITAEQRATIDQVRQEIVDTRRQLRNVQFDMRRDIDRLETRLELFNIVAVPAVLAVLAIALALVRRRRRAAARGGAGPGRE